MPARKIRRNAKRKPYTFNVNAINNKKKKRKQRTKMGAAAVEAAWEEGKTTKANLKAMGLAYDVNELLPQPSTKDLLRRPGVESSDSEGETGPAPPRRRKGGTKAQPSAPLRPKKELKAEVKVEKTAVVEALEAEAAKRPDSAPRVSEPEVLYASRMIQRHGDDYLAMARDASNHYQDTPKQIRRKIEFFKRTQQYQAFLTAQRNLRAKAAT